MEEFSERHPKELMNLSLVDPPLIFQILVTNEIEGVIKTSFQLNRIYYLNEIRYSGIILNI